MQIVNHQPPVCVLNYSRLQDQPSPLLARQCLASQKVQISSDAQGLYQLHEMADSGDKHAQYEVAKKLYEIQTEPEIALECKREARKYFKLAADQGHVAAQNEYADLCYFGLGGELDFAEAFKYFKLAADQGHLSAQMSYARMNYYAYEAGKIDFAEALKYSKLAADQGDAHAQCWYATKLIAYGVGGATERAAALKYLKLAADQDDVEAQYTYALMRYVGEGAPADRAEARKYMTLAADKGYLDAKKVLQDHFNPLEKWVASLDLTGILAGTTTIIAGSTLLLLLRERILNDFSHAVTPPPVVETAPAA